MRPNSGIGIIVLLAACAPPKRDYDAGQIAKVENLKELMDVQATVSDPRFKLAKKLDAKEMSDDDFAQFLDMGQRLQLSAKRIPDWSKGKGFDDFAKKLFSQAGSLHTYAKLRDGANTLKTALEIKKTCSACHSEFR